MPSKNSLRPQGPGGGPDFNYGGIGPDVAGAPDPHKAAENDAAYYQWLHGDADRIIAEQYNEQINGVRERRDSISDHRPTTNYHDAQRAQTSALTNSSDAGVSLAAHQERGSQLEADLDAQTKAIEAAKRMAAIEDPNNPNYADMRKYIESLNDFAELQIYGAKPGRAYTHPQTGEAIPDADIQTNFPGIHNKEYKQSIDVLLAEGFELCQAKLIMDLRSEDEAKFDSLYTAALEAEKEGSKKINGPLSKEQKQELEAKIWNRVSALDAKRKKIILEEGIFTKEEYDARLKKNQNNGNQQQNNGNQQQNNGNQQQASMANCNFIPNPALSQALNLAAEEWSMHIEAARSKSIPLKKGTKGKLEESGNAWTLAKSNFIDDYRNQGENYIADTVKKLVDDKEIELRRAGTLTDVQITTQLNSYGFAEQSRLRAELDKYLKDLDKSISMSTVNHSADMSKDKYDNYPKPVRKALDFWARRGGGKFFSKHRIFGNIAKLAAVGIPAAVVGGIATVATGGMLPVAMAAGALTGLGITKGIGAGLMGARTAKGENAPRVVDAITRDIEAEFDRQLAENGTINHRETNKKTRKITWRNRRRNLTGITVGAGSANIAASVATNLWLTPNVTAVGPGVQPVHATPNGPVSFGPTAPPAPPVTPNGVPISPGDGIINAIDKIFGTVGSPASPDAAYNALLNGNIDPTAVLQDAVSGAPVDVVQMGVPGPGGWGITGAEIGNNVMLTPQAAAYLSNLGMI